MAKREVSVLRAAVPRPRILVTADASEETIAALGELGDVEYASFRETMRLLTGSSLAEALKGVEVFVSEIDVIDASVIQKSPDLRVIAACRGDAVNVDLAACTAFGIPVLHAPGRNADAVADLALAFLLMLARKLPAATVFLRQPEIEAGDMGRMGQAFTTLRGRELWHKTVGLIGFGAVGRAVAKRLSGFGASVLVYDPYLEDEPARQVSAERVPLDELLERSDFVSLHAAVTDETKGMIGAAQLARMKPGAFLVNTARAALVDEGALAESLRSGHLGGAALDVFSTEPPGSDHPLLAFENVIATPHVGGNTEDVATHQGLIIAEDLRRLLQGHAPYHALNPDVVADFDWTEPRRQPDPKIIAALLKRPGPAVSDLQRDAASRPKAPAAGTSAKTALLPPETRQQMQRILRAFVDRMSTDEAIRRFADGKDVTLQFVLPDADTTFFLRLKDGIASGDLLPPTPPAEVELKMSSDVLDGMFTDRLNPMQAATSGDLSFSGDTVKAMTLQEIQQDLSRIYRAARSEIGEPGDLRIAADKPATGHGGAPRAVAGDDVRKSLVDVVNELFAAQLITATGGNVSVRIPGADGELWITPSQLFKGDLKPEILVRIDLDGKSLDADALSPSSERLMHCAVYRARADAQAVIHAHAPHATILANAGLPFLPISTEAAFFGNIPRIPFVMPGTQQLADAIAEAVTDSWAVLMQNHGLLVAGRSLRRAADMVEIIERSAEVILGCYAVGKEPPQLPDDIVVKLRKMGDLLA